MDGRHRPSAERNKNVRYWLFSAAPVVWLRVRYRTQSSRALGQTARAVNDGGFNRSTQHPSLLIWHVGTVCIWRDMHGHGSRGSRRLSSGSAESAANRWRTLRPGARGTRAAYKILILNGGIASAPRRRASARGVASTG